jgi:hypothetical protein
MYNYKENDRNRKRFRFTENVFDLVTIYFIIFVKWNKLPKLPKNFLLTTVSKALKDYSDVSLKLKLQFLWLKNLIIAPIHLLICERKNQRQ